MTNLYQTIRKIDVTLLLGAVGPLYMARGTFSIFIAFTTSTITLRLAYTELDKLPTNYIDETLSISQIEPRISDLPDVVTSNFKNKIQAPSIVQ